MSSTGPRVAMRAAGRNACGSSSMAVRTARSRRTPRSTKSQAKRSLSSSAQISRSAGMFKSSSAMLSLRTHGTRVGGIAVPCKGFAGICTAVSQAGHQDGQAQPLLVERHGHDVERLRLLQTAERRAPEVPREQYRAHAAALARLPGNFGAADPVLSADVPDGEVGTR